MQTYTVRAHCDPDAMVWWAESDDVPGLVAESDTTEQLMAELRRLVPELLTMNDKMPDERPIRMHVIMDQTEELTPA